MNNPHALILLACLALVGCRHDGQRGGAIGGSDTTTAILVADTARIMQARKAIRHALEIQRDKKGYAFVEILSPCPTSVGLKPLDAARFVIEQMEKEYPLGCLRDRSAEAPTRPAPKPWVRLADFFGDDGRDDPRPSAHDVKERHFKFTGFGGQGILSLGLVVADAARALGLETTWLPSYGPEQRGGDAQCTVVTSTQLIGAPAVEHPELLVVMNQAACEKHLHTVRPGGLVLADATVRVDPAQVPQGVRVVQIPAIDIAAAAGVPKAANVAMLGGLLALDALGIPAQLLIEALERSFAKKPALIPLNKRVLQAAIEHCRHHGLTGELP